MKEDARQLRRYIAKAHEVWPWFTWDWLKSEAVRLSRGRAG